jgi:hypothetical protein
MNNVACAAAPSRSGRSARASIEIQYMKSRCSESAISHGIQQAIDRQYGTNNEIVVEFVIEFVFVMQGTKSKSAIDIAVQKRNYKKSRPKNQEHQ